jgi:hypothetical protein
LFYADFPIVRYLSPEHVPLLAKYGPENLQLLVRYCKDFEGNQGGAEKGRSSWGSRTCR